MVIEAKLEAAKKSTSIDHPVISSIKRNSFKSPYGRRYSNFETLIGIGALNIGRKCHRFINNNIMPLPSISTIKNLSSTFMEKVSNSFAVLLLAWCKTSFVKYMFHFLAGLLSYNLQFATE